MNQSWNGELLERTQKASLSSERRLNGWLGENGEKQDAKGSITLYNFV